MFSCFGIFKRPSVKGGDLPELHADAAPQFLPVQANPDQVQVEISNSMTQLELIDRVTNDDVEHECISPTELQLTTADDIKDQPPELTLEESLANNDQLRRVFEAFASFGCHEPQTELDGTKLMKLSKDCGLINAKLTTVDVDLIFLKTKGSREKRHIDFIQFISVLSAFASLKGVPLERLVDTVIMKGGPVSHSTRAENVRLHDDKTTYTGVYKKGGPSTVDDSQDLATMLDRTTRKAPTSLASPMAFSKSMVIGMRRQTLNSGGGEAPQQAMGVESVFEQFATFGNSAAQRDTSGGSHDMTNKNFVKLCQDCGLFDHRYGTTEADLLFRKFASKNKSRNKISFADFQSCLEQIAKDKHMSINQVHDCISGSGGPMVNVIVV